ncbi:hypothetical protein ETU08_03455 [Apibacter muscae]|uniref:Uncharacterized protein n=1 Tax=Apibacter muscae TaxID=2509004 RepID=A0A563DGV5_9FLAO|nr:hypothetical protein [Apibacter muscae]TWP29261.1 hypothetical protein ETU09_03310 [Apibacter muscae]TWP31077.1 hypothetical protein ETU08_03455 [Apibacter muscae]
MKYLSIITIILFTYSCKGHETKVDKIESLNSDSTKYSLVGIWNKLTINKKDTIIYQPCDANNTSIKVTRDSVIIDYGQEILAYFILEKNNYNNKHIEFKLSGTNNKLECIINNKTTAFWIINGTKNLFTKSDISKFKTIEQPCIECWEEDECNNQKDNNLEIQNLKNSFIDLAEKDFKKRLPEILKLNHSEGIDITENYTGDLTNDNIDDLVIYYSLVPGTEENNEFNRGIIIYKNDNGYPKMIKQIEPDYLFNVIGIQNNILQIEKLEYNEYDSRCCPSKKTKINIQAE